MSADTCWAAALAFGSVGAFFAAMLFFEAQTERRLRYTLRLAGTSHTYVPILRRTLARTLASRRILGRLAELAFSVAAGAIGLGLAITWAA